LQAYPYILVNDQLSAIVVVLNLLTRIFISMKENMDSLNFASNSNLPSENAYLDVPNNSLSQDIFQVSAWNRSTQQLYSFSTHHTQPGVIGSCDACTNSTKYFNSDIAPLVRLALKGFSESTEFAEKIKQAFGYGANVEQGRILINNLVTEAVIPDIKILGAFELQAKGAFGDNTIYLSQDLLNPQLVSSQEAANVLLEEVGHYIDSQINIQDAVGDEGEIFAGLVQNKSFTSSDLAALRSVNDHGSLNINGQNIAVEHADLDPGIFLVDSNGKVSIDFLADAGAYRSEMAVFSLQGMDAFTPGSAAYTKEATRRALSNSALGYVVVNDSTEGARFNGELGEVNKNDGNYAGRRSYSFNPGDRVALLIIPQGTVQQVFDSPSDGGNLRPLFSIAAANPNGVAQIGQLVAGTFGWEDIRVDQGTDADYNDIVFKVRGAAGIAADLGQLIAANKDWRSGSAAKELIDFANLNLAAALAQDTGLSSSDSITNNSNISGLFSNNVGNINKLQARFGDSGAFVDISADLQANGSFAISKDRLTQILGRQLVDGSYELNLRTEDKSGILIDEVNIKFTFDGTNPIVSQSSVRGSQNSEASSSTPVIFGQAEAGARVEIFDGTTKLGEARSVDSNWEITTAQLTDGAKDLTVITTDVAGNSSGGQQLLITVDASPVQQLSVMPGGILRLESKDIFGKNAVFALDSAQPLPAGVLDSDGTLTFQPTPAQLGTYDFRIVARDGEQVTSKRFSVSVVADPVTTTRISGVIQSVAQASLAGVVVRIGDVSGVTDADGAFTLTLPELPAAGVALVIQPGQQVNGVVYPSIAEPLPLLLGHEVYQSLRNVIDRPIYLPAIDISNAQTIDPTVTQTVISAAIPGSAVVVAANSLFTRENQPFTGQLSITTVPTALTPAALPDGLRPDLVVTIQPGDMVFNTPAPLSLPNQAGFAPGTQMDLWSINPATGVFDKVGVGQVNADGTVINTISGGIRNSSWHFFSPPPPTANDPNADDRNPDDGCDECKAKVPGTSEVELHSGAVIETHNLAAYRSLGASRGLSLRYDSERADARPILHFGYNNVQSDPNLRLTAELTVKRGDFRLEVPGFAGGQYGLNGGENFWSIPTGTGKVDAALQADLRNVASGRYDYELTTGLMRLNNNQFSGSTSMSAGQFLHVNTSNSAFGSGWGLAGLQELVVNNDGSVLVIDGDGSELLFERNAEGGGYKSPIGDFSTLERLGDGTFRRTMTDQMVYTFNTDNLLAGMRDRVGNETTYSYQNRLLTKMVDPVGLETVFAYSGSKIASITDPAGRSTRLTYDANGNLTKITDPDGTSRTWEYDAGHHMVAEVDKRGDREQTFYDFAGRASRSIRKDGSELKFDPVQVQGLYEASRTANPLDAPAAFRLGDVSSTYTDANGQKIVSILDQSGQIVSSSDEVGLLPAVKRNADNLVTQQTDARGNIATFTYDTKGNVLTSQDSLSFSNSQGGNVLIVNGLSGSSESGTTSGSTDNLVQILKDSGFQTTVADTLPTDITAFSEIWDIRFSNNQAISEDQSAQYLSFLQSGKELFLVGENGSFSTRNNSVIGFVDRAGGGTLNFSIPSSTQQVNSAFRNPNDVSSISYPNPGGLANTGSGQFITQDGSSRGSAILFKEGDLINAKSGKLVTIFDINIFQDTSDQSDSRKLLRNLIQSDFAPKRFTYDSKFSQVTSYTDELGHQKLYEVDQNNGNLLSLTQVVGAVGGDDDLISKFTYTDKGLVDLITDPLGRVTDNDYDARGRLIAMTYAQGTIDEAKRQFAYDAAGNQTAVTDENGNVTQIEYDALNRVVKITEADPDGTGSLLSPVTTYIYDADGNVVSTTDAVGNVSQNVYDKLDRLVQSVDALNQKTDYSYDAIGNLLTVVDSLSHKTENKYDKRNRITETIAPDQGITKFDYDLSNNLIAVTDQVGNKTNFTYDARNRKTSEIDALGKTTQYQFDAANNLIGQVDRNGNRTQYRYDDLNRQIQMQDALGRVSSYVYDKANNLTSQTDPLNRVMQYTYDNRDRQKTVTDPLGGVMSYTYDDFSNITAMTDELNRTTTYGYDALNRRIAITDPLSQTARMVYDGVDNLLSMTDAVGQITRYEYDKLNRRVKMTDGKGEIYTTEYDAEDNVVSMIDPVGNKTTYTYDVNDRRIGETNATAKTIAYQYDLAGNQLAVIDRNGRTRQFTYDKLNRQVSEKWLDASNTSVNDVNYTYDAVGNLLAASDANSKYAYTYDAVYNLTSVDNKDTAGVPNVVLASSYDAADNLLKVTDTISGVLKGDTSYVYDALNRATQVTQSGSGVSTKRVDMAYDAASQMTGMNRFNDLAGLSTIVSSLYTYDGKGRLTGLNYKRGGNNIADYAFNFDAIDRITQTTSIDGTSNYTYDKTNQLAAADHSFQTDEAYTVDGNGNRTNAGYSTGVNNRLTSDGVFNYEYDANGNRTKRTEIANGNVTEYVWNHRDRLTKVTSKDAAGIETKTAEYTYDVNNRRIAKAVDADGSGTATPTIERYVYDGQNIVLSFDGSGTQTHRYLHGTGVDQVLADENAQATLWTLADHQGSIRDVLDNTGALQNHIVYDSFGKITSQTNASATTIYGYTGREYDSETGLYFYRARYYDPNTGGFISEDPIGFEAGDYNLYRYVGNSPTNFIDPSGLTGEQPSLLNRITGGLRAIGGAIQAIGGGTLAIGGTAGTAGIGAAPAIIGGGLIAARGIDDFQAGIRQLFTGLETNSLTFEGVKNLTGNCTVAGLVDFGTGLISPGAVIKGIGGSRTLPILADNITIYRGTSHTLEIQVLQDSGYVMSDAARRVYTESIYGGVSNEEALSLARLASENAHGIQVRTWGNLNNYVQAHSAFGTEISVFGPRSMTSFTTDPNIASSFAGRNGIIISAEVPRNSVIFQTLPGANESEVLVPHILRVGK
jgi:RHS repeat-associated protein